MIVRENLGEKAVVKNSAADQAGLKEYDIILELNGEKISEENPLTDILQKYKIADIIFLKILREGKEMNVKLKLEEKK